MIIERYKKKSEKKSQSTSTLSKITSKCAHQWSFTQKKTEKMASADLAFFQFYRFFYRFLKVDHGEKCIELYWEHGFSVLISE